MDAKGIKKLSKFLSLVLRHRPERIGIELDVQGWTPVSELLRAMATHGRPITRQVLEVVVAQNDKQRFALSEDGRRIRANQGHSVDVDLGYEAAVPPELLYHGTVAAFLAGIRKHGLKKHRRHHVHLSTTRQTATQVGARRGNPIILVVHAGEMHRAGHLFHVTPNGVWLTEEVPASFIEFPGEP